LRTKSLHLWGIAVLLFFPPPSSASNDFIVPGVDFSHMALTSGAWCRYLIVDEALGQVDSTDVYIGLPSREITPRGPAVWVEIETRVRGGRDEGGELMKFLVLEDIVRSTEGDTLADYVLKLYIKKGFGSAAEEDPGKYENFSLIHTALDSSWTYEAEQPVRTPAGDFSCTMKTKVTCEEQHIPTGTVKIIKKVEDRMTVWSSDTVSIFHMVKCVIERSRETETVPRLRGIPVSGKKESRTTAELTGFGFDAKPVMLVGSSPRHPTK
jgi:hypothetical protein